MEGTAEAWREAATFHEGSWWPRWDAWLAGRSNGKVAPRRPGEAPGFTALDDAPGTYVRAGSSVA